MFSSERVKYRGRAVANSLAGRPGDCVFYFPATEKQK